MHSTEASSSIMSIQTPPSSPEQAVVYVIDDDTAMCQSLSWLVQSMHWKVEAYNNAKDFLSGYNPDALSCLILDVRMPNMSGLALQENLKKQNINVPIIFITGHGDVKMAVRAMKAGAMEFLNKPFNDQELLDSIQRSLEYARKNRQKEIEKRYIQKRINTLTARELQILQLLIQGKMNKVIAYDLNLSIKTIELHRSNIMRKFKSPTMTALLSILYRNHIDLNKMISP